jgi:hypothetical protein
MAGRNEGIIISGGGGIHVDQLAVGRGSKVNAMHVGNGSNVNVGSSLTGVQQTEWTNAAPGGADEQDLAALLNTLKKLLETVPANKSDEAKAVAAQATQLVEAAGKAHPNRTMLQVVSSGLKQTAEFLADAVPGSVTVARQIVNLVAKLHGIGL